MFIKKDLRKIDEILNIIPVDDLSVSVVCSSSVLEYTENLNHILMEFNRVMKLDGVLIFSIPDMRNPIRIAEAQWLSKAKKNIFIKLLPKFTRTKQKFDYLRLSKNRFSYEIWEKLLINNGFLVKSDVGRAIHCDPLLIVIAVKASKIDQ
jgi:SAM-dependent methyltransferase